MGGADSIREASVRIRRARRIAVLTGAGISTPSGIPDFRSADGIYSDERTANVFDIGEFRRRPELFYRFAREFYPLLERAQPNAAHRALAEWEHGGKEVHIATQNIDDLHQRAGSTRVYPVHGTVETSTCMDCGQTRQTHHLVSQVMAGDIPRCECGGVFKPDITFFGEMLPEIAWDRAVAAMRQADLILVIGTSLAVYPAASLPDYRKNQAELILVNRDPTPLDAEAHIVLRGDLAALLDEVARFLRDE